MTTPFYQDKNFPVTSRPSLWESNLVLCRSGGRKVLLQYCQRRRQCSLRYRGWTGWWYCTLLYCTVCSIPYCPGVSQLGDGFLSSNRTGPQARPSRLHRQQQEHQQERGRRQGEEARDGGVHRGRSHRLRSCSSLQKASVLQPGLEALRSLLFLGKTFSQFVSWMIWWTVSGLVHPGSDVPAGRVLRQVRSEGLLQAPLLPGGPPGQVREAPGHRPHPHPLQLCLLCQPRPRKQVRRREISENVRGFL